MSLKIDIKKIKTEENYFDQEEIKVAMNTRPEFEPSKSFSEEQLSIHNKESIT